PAIPAKLFFQHLAGGRDHVVESANVRVHIRPLIRGTILNDLSHVLLHVSTRPFPRAVGAAEGDDVVEIGEIVGDEIEVILVVNVCGISSAIYEMDLLVLM